MSYEKRVVLISGGSRGLGQALVEGRLRAGDVVATFSRAPSTFTDRQCAADPKGARFHWEAVDGADTAAVRTFAQSVARRYGRIDAVICNAGMALDGLLTMTREDDIRRLLTVNLEAAIILIRACLKPMLAAQSGSVISITSVNGLRGHKGLSVYSATKAGLDGMTRSLAREVGPQGITVNSLAPGFFESDMVEHLPPAQRMRIVKRTPMRALATVDDLVRTVDFLLLSRSITGQTIAVDGGFSC